MKYPTNNEIWYAEQRDRAIEERDLALTRAEAAQFEAAALRARLAELDLGAWSDEQLHEWWDEEAARELVARLTARSEGYAWDVGQLTAENAALRAQVAELEAADQWRPKNSGSVPDEHEPVFAMVDKNGVEHPAIVEYSDGQWFNSWIRVHVTRWLPPPAPPTEAPAP